MSGVSYNVAYAWFYIGITYIISIGLTSLEIMMIQFLSIVVLKRMLPLLDDFFAMFFQVANLVIGFFLAVVSGSSEELYPRIKRSLALPQFVPIMSKPQNFNPR